MSQYFALGEQTLWNPSNGAARLFLRQVSVFEAELGLPSGIGQMRDDECQIDAAVLKTFVEALLEQHLRTSHAVMIALSESFVAIMLILAERAGIDLAWLAGSPVAYDNSKDVQVPSAASGTISACTRPDRLRAEARELSRFMAR
ncbi:DUF6086 family protein [Streptomyces sp. NPDC047022]|uniref:DUF6086 family protein n=1 Tax=Streptomyces sp. NPDC047022 TaxID=3155737 RepID=UPI0033E5F0FC